MIKMLFGFIFCLGMVGFVIYKRKIYGLTSAIITAIVAILASILFLGQFISKL